MPNDVIQSKLLARIPGLAHGFTTRLTPPEISAELEAKVSTAHQVHKDQFLWPSAWERRTHEADGVGTLAPRFFVGAYSADCTPILLALDDGQKIAGIMAVHAGWRGTALEITRKAVGALLAKSGIIRPAGAKIFAAIGPCIGFENFEVGEDVVMAFPHSLPQGLARPLRREGNKQKYLFDLPGENIRQLRNGAAEAGVALEVDNLGLCTVADARLFPSFRRDRESAGRILSYIAFGTDHP